MSKESTDFDTFTELLEWCDDRGFQLETLSVGVITSSFFPKDFPVNQRGESPPKEGIEIPEIPNDLYEAFENKFTKDKLK